MDEEEDLSKFTEAEDDVKPIDVGGNPVPEDLGAPIEGRQDHQEKMSPRFLDDAQEKDNESKEQEEGEEAEIPKPEFPEDDDKHDDSLSGDVVLSHADLEEDKKRLAELEKREQYEKAKQGIYDDASHFIKKGEYIDLLEKAPTLKRVLIGAGWDTRSFEDEPVDVDISMFMLDKKDMTRVDEDFIFYNNDRAFDGAVYHMGDSRSGAGDGDDENIFIDLNGLPFDILKIVFVLSIYDPELEGHHFGLVRNVFFRIVNKDDDIELFRYKLEEEDLRGGNSIIVGSLIREGARWIFESSADAQNGGLAKVATDYGIIVKELQSTGDDVDMPES